MTDPRSQWKWAAKKANLLKDPWRGLGFERLQEMIVQRHVYNPRTKKWWKDDISIKMEEKPFAKGAMRRCYRMKKLSKFSHQPDWDHASNYVAKCYIQEQPRSVYEQDVQLQMDSKLWGEKYSRKDPPKKVDFCQAYLIEVQSSNGNNGLYCVEHFIDGEYVKYNSNSGFVNDINRLTPQAFSHFTFEDSGHQCIVVDIQGVGDLYTDPQMHTLDFTEYGEANLGTRGMALFFSSHLCSPLCSTLGLTQFDLSPQEIDRLKSQEWRVTSSKTIVSPSNTCDEKKPLPQSSAECVVESISEAFQRIELTLDLSSHDHKSFIESPLLTPKDLPLSNFLAVEAMEGKDNDIKDNDIHVNDQEDVSKSKIQRYRSIGRSASVVKETGLAEDIEQVKHKLQTLGQVHYELCVYHLLGRFTKTIPDPDSAMYHLKKAGDCGLPKALYLLGCIYQQLPHQQLEELTVEQCSENKFIGFNYFLQAAECGLHVAMVIVAQAYETGDGLASVDTNTKMKPRTRDFTSAVKWYLEALETPPLPLCELDEFAPQNPGYSLLSKVAYLHETGGFGLETNFQKAGDYYQQAGDLAMESMKGKLATKYYSSAEECWSKIE